MSRLRPVSGANYIAPTRLADGKASLDPLRSVLVVIYLPSVLVVCVGVFFFLVEVVG